MPETVFKGNHEVGADNVCVWCRHLVRTPDLGCDLKGRILELEQQLRQAWNARGAADIEAAKYAPGDRYGAAYPDLGEISDAIQALDR